MKLLFLILILIAVMHFSLFIGKYPITFFEYIEFAKFYLFGESNLDSDKIQVLKSIIVDIRIPRILSAVIIGSSLAVAGTTFQSMFVNPLVSPGILGVLAGASFGAALGMVFGLSWFYIQTLTFLFGFIAVLIAIFISLIFNVKNMILLVLGGVISSSLFTSLLSILKYSADPNDTLPAIVYWLMGSLAFSDKNSVFLLFIPMLIGIIILIFSSKYLNALSLGDEEAKSLGVNVVFIKTIAIFFATLISAMTVVLAGVIGWVGLIIPHICRMLFGADNKIVIPSSAIVGAIFLLVADNFSRTLFEHEIPLGILTSLVGIPIFIIVLKNAKEGFN